MVTINPYVGNSASITRNMPQFPSELFKMHEFFLHSPFIMNKILSYYYKWISRADIWNVPIFVLGSTKAGVLETVLKFADVTNIPK